MKIFDKEYTVKPNLRAMFIFEQITGKAFSISTLMDEYIYFYACLMAGQELDFDFDKFIDECSENETLFQQFMDILNKEAERKKLLADKNEDGTVKKKRAKNSQ